MDTKNLHMIVGLGNPGERYKNTRHNAGFLITDFVADKYGISLNKRKFQAKTGRGMIEGVEVLLVKPQTYMNNSGLPAYQAANYYKIKTTDILIIHDDIDIVFGRLKIKQKGGDGGHKGVKSIVGAFGNNAISRLRVGVGRGNYSDNISDYVLNRFNCEEAKIIKQVVISAMEAVVSILCKGIEKSMNNINQKNSNVSN